MVAVISVIAWLSALVVVGLLLAVGIVLALSASGCLGLDAEHRARAVKFVDRNIP
ncbi:MAG: hypothetical protein AAFN30_15840 [Actinomycetota bacterium]